jgi:hypothetical protein
VDVQSYPNFLGSFGRAGSGEDVGETGREERNEDMQYLAEFRTAKVQKSESGMRDCGLYKHVSEVNVHSPCLRPTSSKLKLNSMALVPKRTIPTERPTSSLILNMASVSVI